MVIPSARVTEQRQYPPTLTGQLNGSTRCPASEAVGAAVDKGSAAPPN